MIHGIVLAAGFGRRIGTAKAFLSVGGLTYLERAVRVFGDAGLKVLVVINRQIEPALPPATAWEQRVVNVDPDQGMFSSVRLGVEIANSGGASGAILLPVDHPLVSSGDIALVAAELQRGAAVVVPAWEGRRGHPIGISRAVVEEILQANASSTLRDVVRRDPSRVVEVKASEGTVQGVNTKEDLQRVSERSFR